MAQHVLLCQAQTSILILDYHLDRQQSLTKSLKLANTIAMREAQALTKKA